MHQYSPGNTAFIRYKVTSNTLGARVSRHNTKKKTPYGTQMSALSHLV